VIKVKKLATCCKPGRFLDSACLAVEQVVNLTDLSRTPCPSIHQNQRYETYRLL